MDQYPYLKKFIKVKVPLSKAETVREAYNWYNKKWQRDYPDLNMKYSTAYRRRPYKPLYGRRLTDAKRAIILSPSPSSKRRKGSQSSNFSRTGKIGEDIGLENCKRAEVLTADFSMAGTSIEVHQDMTAITKGTGINNRERDVVNCRGFKLRYYFHHVGLNPATVHVAVIAPKQTWDISTTVTRGNDFLRGYASARDLNLGTALSGIQVNRNPINADRFCVLMHKKINIGVSGSGANYMTGVQPNFHRGEAYVPLDRQLRYDSTGGECETPVYVVSWYDADARGSAETWSTFDATSAMGTHFDVVTYFKEPT